MQSSLNCRRQSNNRPSSIEQMQQCGKFQYHEEFDTKRKLRKFWQKRHFWSSKLNSEYLGQLTPKNTSGHSKVFCVCVLIKTKFSQDYLMGLAFHNYSTTYLKQIVPCSTVVFAWTDLDFYFKSRHSYTCSIKWTYRTIFFFWYPEYFSTQYLGTSEYFSTQYLVYRSSQFGLSRYFFCLYFSGPDWLDGADKLT